jgi:hypothetical protein|nr:DUF4124 domain-containing protein [Variovorax sp. E3]
MRSPALVFCVLATAALVASAAGSAHAEVVRCTDANGAISYTNVECPPGSKQARQVSILESPPAEPVRRPASSATPSSPSITPPPPVQAAGNPSPGLAIIPRYPNEQASSEPPPVYILGPDPYYDDGVRPIRRPRPPHPHDAGPPPGQRPCANLAGIKRNNC